MWLVRWTCLILGGIILSEFEHILELSARDLVWSFFCLDGRAHITGTIVFIVTFGDEPRSYHGLNVLTSLLLATYDRHPFLENLFFWRRLLRKILLNKNSLISDVGILL